MVKFAKQLEAQLVPEWRAAYVTYKLLKKDLNIIKQHGRAKEAGEANSTSLLWPGATKRATKRTPSFARVQSFVAQTGHAFARHKDGHGGRSPRSSIIQVSKADHDSLEIYKSVLVERIELDGPFFSRLDSQFNKVNQFYADKEKEFAEQSDALEEQLHTLIEMRRRLSERKNSKSKHSSSRAPESEDDDDEEDKIREAMESGRVVMKSTDQINTAADVLRKDGSGFHHRHHDSPRHRASAVRPEDDTGQEMSEITLSEDAIGSSPGKQSQRMTRQLTMRMKVPMSTPGTTISMLSHTLWEDIVKQVNRSWNVSESKNKSEARQLILTEKNIKLAEKMLRAAFVEFYRGLNLLKGFSSLNLLAFAKITKKYDKVSGKHAAAVYLKTVETSYFCTSDKIVKLMDKVEGIFTYHFASANRQKAMMILRPQQRRDSHKVTFALGFFTGGLLFLSIVFAILLRQSLPHYRAINPSQRGSLPEEGETVYYQTVFRGFSMVALILLHMNMYGINLYLWRKMRINYPFMFAFRAGTELRHREVLMVAAILSTILTGAMMGQLALNATTLSSSVDLIPLWMVLILAVLLFLPFNICYRSSRVFFLRALYHNLCAPLYKVVLVDFFVADQLTSQVPMLRNLEFVMCYYLGGSYKTGNPNKCLSDSLSKAFLYLVSLLPYWWRLMQCLRRFFDESDRDHIANAVKYTSALVAVAVRIEYSLNSTTAWLVLVIVASTFATALQVYWDLVIDWGLLQRRSKNPWLRDQLMMPKKKYMYYIAMVVNVALRMAWLQTVLEFRIGHFNPQAMDFLFASLEVIRRGHWNFYRLENEHVGNVGKFRATKTVPLPFERSYARDEDD